VFELIRSTTVASTLALTLLLTACSAGGPSSAGAPGAEDRIEALHVVLPPARGLDLTTSFNIQTHSLVGLALETLMTIDDNGEIVPNLATAVENPDPQTYVYTLRDGVTFWDGSPMTVDDVVHSLQRNTSSTSQLAARFAPVESIAAEGGDRVVIRLKAPNATFAYIPALYGHVVKKEYAEQQGDALGTSTGLTMGTGPFRPVSYTPDAGADFEANEAWWGGAVGVGEVRVQFSNDSASAALAMASGEIDFAMNVDPKSYASLDDVELLSASTGDQTGLSMNVNQPPFDDIHVRRAVAHAVNREGIASAAVGEFGTPNPTLVPDATWATLLPDDELAELRGSLPSYDYDLAKAADELARSGYPRGFPVSARIIDNDPAMRIAGQAISADLAEIGIDLTIEPTPVSTWLDELTGPRDRIGLMFTSLGGSIPDPDKFLYDWLAGANAVEGGFNTADFRNAEVEALIAAERAAALDDPRRVAAFRRILEIAGGEVPYVPLYTTNKTAVLAEAFTWQGGFTGFYYTKPWALQIAYR
jgi:peptide/nickel transport system substrate-binding protein